MKNDLGPRYSKLELLAHIRDLTGGVIHAGPASFALKEMDDKRDYLFADKRFRTDMELLAYLHIEPNRVKRWLHRTLGAKPQTSQVPVPRIVKRLPNYVVDASLLHNVVTKIPVPIEDPINSGHTLTSSYFLVDGQQSWQSHVHRVSRVGYDPSFIWTFVHKSGQEAHRSRWRTHFYYSDGVAMRWIARQPDQVRGTLYETLIPFLRSVRGSTDETEAKPSSLPARQEQYTP